MPISPKLSTLLPSSAHWRTTRAPPARHCSISASVIAGQCRKLRVPRPTFRSMMPRSRGRSKSTPASTTLSLNPCWRQRKLTPPVPWGWVKWQTCCQVTSFGAMLTPSSTIPWSAAKTIFCGCRSSGESVCWIRPICKASSSSRPSDPFGLVRLSILACSAGRMAESGRSIWNTIDYPLILTGMPLTIRITSSALAAAYWFIQP